MSGTGASLDLRDGLPDFTDQAAVIASPTTWRDQDKILVGTDGSKYIYDFEKTTALPVDGMNVFAVAGGFFIKETIAQYTTTSITPLWGNGSAYEWAILSLSVTKEADVLLLSDGSKIRHGLVRWVGHGLTQQAYYYTSQTVAGGYVTPAPTSGNIQQLFYVVDANTIAVDISPYFDTPAIDSFTTGVVNANTPVAFGNLRVQAVSAGQGFQMSTVSGTYAARLSGWSTYGLNADAQFATSRDASSITTTMAHPFGWAASNNKGNEIRLTVTDELTLQTYQVLIHHGGTVIGAKHMIRVGRVI